MARLRLAALCISSVVHRGGDHGYGQVRFMLTEPYDGRPAQTVGHGAISHERSDKADTAVYRSIRRPPLHRGHPHQVTRRKGWLAVW